MIGLPVELSQSDASMAHTQLALASVSFLKGASEEVGGGDENKNKFEKLKANRSQSKERKFVPKCRRKNLLGVFAMTTWASTSGNFKAISSSSLSFEGGTGGKGRRGMSDPKCNQ